MPLSFSPTGPSPEPPRIPPDVSKLGLLVEWITSRLIPWVKDGFSQTRRDFQTLTRTLSQAPKFATTIATCEDGVSITVRHGLGQAPTHISVTLNEEGTSHVTGTTASTITLVCNLASASDCQADIGVFA